VLVTGGAGYVGSVLVPKLLAAGHGVKVLDLYLYGDHVLDAVRDDPRLEQIKGDMRDREVLREALAGCDAVIHLACVSNDPSFELNPELGKAINYTVTIRSATVCGYSPRLRLDLTVNILTNHAVNRGTITVFGGDQKRPNIHIEDITDLYTDLLTRPDARIAGKVWNAGYENHRVSEIADMVRTVVGPEKVKVVTSPTDDHRSYHISSEKIRRELGFVARRSLEGAVRDLAGAFRAGKVPNPMDDIRYYNVKTMQALNLK
jgi:nucleoside-diphosphate-sugar epimerase